MVPALTQTSARSSVLRELVAFVSICKPNSRAAKFTIQPMSLVRWRSFKLVRLHHNRDALSV